MLKPQPPLLCAGLLAVLFLLAMPALAQYAPGPQKMGTVTAVQGQATVTRQTLPQPTALHFKDDIFSRDQLTTQERSTLRLLLTGKGILTISGQSQVRLDQTVASGGSRRLVVSLLQGEIGVTLARGLMRPGEAVAIHTPIGVVEVEQGVLVVKCLPTGAETCGGSTISVLSGEATVTPKGQPPVTLDPMHAVSLNATPTGIQTSAVQPLSSDQVAQVTQGLQPGKPHTAEPEGSRMAQTQSQLAAGVATAILEATTGQTAPTALTAASPPTNTIAPITPEVAVNVLPSGSLLSLNGYQLGLAAGTSLGTFSDGLANRVDPINMSGPGRSVATNPLLPVTGSPILHSGPVITLDNAASVAGASTDTTTPLLRIDGAEVTNVGGPIFGLRGNSAISTFGPLVSVDPSTLTLEAPILSATESSVTLGGPLLRVVDSEVTGTTPDSGLARLINSDLSLTGGSLLESQGSTLTFAAPLVSGGMVLYIPEEAPKTRVDPPFTGVRSSTPGKPLFHLVGGSLTLTGNGALLAMNGGLIDVAGSFLVAEGARIDASAATDPLVRLDAAVLNLTNGGSLISLGSGSSMNPGGTVFYTDPSKSVSIDGPVFALRDGRSLTLTAGPLVQMNTSQLSLEGPILNAERSSVQIGGPLLRVVDSKVTGTTTNSGLAHLDNSPLSLASASLLESQGSTLLFNGPLLYVTQFLCLVCPSQAVSVRSSTPGKPLFHLVGGSLTLTGNGALFAMNRGLIDVAGSLLAAEGARIDASSATGPFVRLAAKASNLMIGGNLISLGSGSSMNAGGTVFDIYLSEFVTIDGPVFALRDGSSLTVSNGPMVRMDQSQSTLDSLLTIGTASTVSLGGPLLNATDSPLTVAGNLVNISDGGRLASTTPEPLIQLTRSPLTIGSGFFLADGNLSLAGPLLVATDSPLAISTINTSFTVAIPSQSAVTQSTGIDPLVQLTRSSLAVRGFGSFLVVGYRFREEYFLAGPRIITLAGPLLLATDSYVFAGTSFVQLTGPEAFLTSSSTGPFIQMTRSPLTVGSYLLSLSNWPPLGSDSASATVSLAGPLLVAAESPITTGYDLLVLGSRVKFTSTTSQALVQLTASQLTAGGTLLTIGASNTVSLGGPLLNATDSSMSVAGSLVSISDGGRLTSTTSEGLIQLTRSPLTAGRRFLSIAPTSTLALAGPLLIATDSPLSTGSDFMGLFGPGAAITSTTTQPLVQLTGSPLTVWSTSILSSPDFAIFFSTTTGSSPMVLAGPLLVAIDSPLKIRGSFVSATRVTLESTTPNPFVQLTRSPLTAGEDFLYSLHDASIILGGPLLVASDSSLSTGYDFLGLYGPAVALTSTTTQPLIQLIGSPLTAGRDFLADLDAASILAGPLLVATDSPLVMSRDFLRLSGVGASFTNATPDPLVQLTRSPLTTGSHFLNMSGAITVTSTLVLAGPLLVAADTPFQSAMTSWVSSTPQRP